MASSVVYRRNRALIIGINKYRRDPLQYCVNDAEDLNTNPRSIDFDITLELNYDLNQFYKIIDRFVDTIQHEETNNDRNGIFIEKLLKYIAKSNQDIEDIMRNVACDVNSQRGGFQLPYRTSSLIEKFS
ncbi:unnamed protein product [Rotaria sp. Silwood1]|nr:unnamed protein product [Rotaria sp. Silwood1]CAF1185725.1 unnamed protein product [Rotaria sp. Silwood1]CAF3447661.1 unnamed protein product [Rotaria sp. Silwood1]CAF3478948.1 unnamed protein product [Rotaria sp. Silwood1]CAF3488561.1 unnamed protein product [Rotaria sp. Silwood1]